ncbi:uncharacterized protein LOC112552845 [Pogonomyrmex barbatus]|uniref:Uncharacterized protein LOC112552845 n=1 Tax=Pogonomyrmex barbatus TaxID=144034 RepID=A0A8N1S7Y4_9HYME|nr:uncharacterized protein LOC112552845 [Pogonomyrmex barbatus]
MEVPSQQPADHVLAAARAAGLLRRHARLRGQNVESAQGKQRENKCRDKNVATSTTRFLISGERRLANVATRSSLELLIPGKSRLILAEIQNFYLKRKKREKKETVRNVQLNEPSCRLAAPRISRMKSRASRIIFTLSFFMSSVQKNRIVVISL